MCWKEFHKNEYAEKSVPFCFDFRYQKDNNNWYGEMVQQAEGIWQRCRIYPCARTRVRGNLFSPGKFLENYCILWWFFEKLLYLAKFLKTIWSGKILRKIFPFGEIFSFCGRFCTSGIWLRHLGWWRQRHFRTLFCNSSQWVQNAGWRPEDVFRSAGWTKGPSYRKCPADITVWGLQCFSLT